MKESNDILTLFESLNNHEVLTPPRLAKQMLELFPDEVWAHPEYKFLDPCVKSGVFLREIFYKLFDGLNGKGKFCAGDGITYNLDDNRQRINHIFKNMLYGIATSELTGYISRRTLYGVMEADSDKQLSAVESFERSKNFTDWTERQSLDFIGRNQFNDYYNHSIFKTKEYEGFEKEGNIFYPISEVEQIVAEDGNFIIEDTYFPFIDERTEHRKILDIKEQKMKFDVIIGNPPYQVSDGGGIGTSAVPVYQKFVSQAKKLNSRYLTMIIPSRWFSGGRGLDSFRNEMLNDRRIHVLHDFISASECFSGVEIKGGVCYFLWEKDYKGDCSIFTHNGKDIKASTRPLLEKDAETFIRYGDAISILRKVQKFNEESFSNLISANDPFGFDVREKNSYKRVKPNYNSKSFDDSVEFYYNGWRTEGVGYIAIENIRKNTDWINKYKILIPKAWGTGDSEKDWLTPFVINPESCCTETYLVVGAFETEAFVANVISYMQTKFFHFLVSLIKNTQNAMKKVYSFVPLQDFSESWTDEKLYQKYALTDEEIAFIDSLIKPTAI